MDFFQAQDDAHRKSGQLVFFFGCAVVAIVVAVNAIVFSVVYAVNNKATGRHYDGRGKFNRRAAMSQVDPIGLGLVTSLVTVSIIWAGSAWKANQLRGGGGPVAMSLGGRRITQNTRDPYERRLLNVVEEMSIASGCPAPQVYVLRDERGINIFAAGNSPGDAILAVTRGALLACSRDELQGMVAHEFSHILNGDMRLNLRLLGVLHGILMLATIGYYLMRMTAHAGSSRDKGAGAIVLVGLGIMCIGYIGVFFGRLIKGRIVKQREMLADASAVQFTRNPAGVAGAMIKIGGARGGSFIRSPEAEEAAHMFFAAPIKGGGMHPSLRQRIKAIWPEWDGKFPKYELPDERDEPADWDERQEQRRARRDERMKRLEKTPVGQMLGGLTGGGETLAGGVDMPIALTPMLVLASIGAPGEEHVAYAEALHDSIPDKLKEEIHDPFGATAVIYALLCDQNDREIRRAQLIHLNENAARGTAQEVQRIYKMVKKMGPAGAIPLADLCMAALRELTVEQYDQFLENIHALIVADAEVTLFEMAIEKMVQRHLEQHFRPTKSGIKYAGINGVAPELSLVISAACHVGAEEPSAAKAAFDKAAASLKVERLQFLPQERCAIEDVSAALDKLDHAHPRIKKRTIEALTAAIAADGVVTVGEGELLRAVADALECPMPPLVGAPQSA